MARKEKAYRWSNFGLVVVIRGHEELFFEFGQEAARDACLQLLNEGVDAAEKESIHKDGELPSDDILGVPPDQIWFKTTQTLNDDRYAGLQADLSMLGERSDEETPAVMFDSSAVSMVSFKPAESLRFTCLTIGSRGDVQPYIALCKVLIPPPKLTNMTGSTKRWPYRQNRFPRRIPRMDRRPRHRIRPRRRRPRRTHAHLH